MASIIRGNGYDTFNNYCRKDNKGDGPVRKVIFSQVIVYRIK